MNKTGLLVITTSGVGKTTLTDMERDNKEYKLIDFNYRPWMFFRYDNLREYYMEFYKKMMNDPKVMLFKNLNNTIDDYIIDPKRTVIVRPSLDSKQDIIEQLSNGPQRQALIKKINDIDRLFEKRVDLMQELSDKYNIEIIEIPKGKHLSDLFDVLVERLNN